MHKLKVNFLGTGIEIRKIVLPTELKRLWEEMPSSKDKCISGELFDPFFYHKLRHPKYKSVEDLPCQITGGFVNDQNNQIEIWLDRKKIFKTNTSEIFYEDLLFPLFTTIRNSNSIIDNGIFTFQKEVGTIACYEMIINSDLISIFDFTFEISREKDYSFITQFKYHNKELKFVKKDTVITYQTSYEI